MPEARRQFNAATSSKKEKLEKICHLRSHYRNRRSRPSVVACEQVYRDEGTDQIDPEWRSRHPIGSVARESLRTV